MAKNKMHMEMTGFEEIIDEFEKMGRDNTREIEREALRAGAEVVQRNQSANWNRSGANDESIKDNIVIGRAREVKEGTSINVSPVGRLKWRAKFVEYGTSRQPPQSPIERSHHQSESEATNAMMRIFEKVIE
jgi:HK97 gp10 family phage protein